MTYIILKISATCGSEYEPEIEFNNDFLEITPEYQRRFLESIINEVQYILNKSKLTDYPLSSKTTVTVTTK